MTRSFPATVASPATIMKSLFAKRKVRRGVVIGVGSLAALCGSVLVLGAPGGG